MLRHRIIPVVLLNGEYSVVKTVRFGVRRNLGNPITVARVYNTRDVDELILLDIDASKENRTIDFYTVEDIASECFMPLSVGGGIKTIKDIGQALACGADRVVLNSVIIDNPNFISEAVSVFGGQCIVASIDVKRVDGKYEIFTQLNKKPTLFEHLSNIEKFGAGEIIINSVDKDGTMSGYDTDLAKMVCDSSSVPVIICGGASSPVDCVDAIQAGASAVAMASMFHFTGYTPMDCKVEMNKNGIPVRI